MTVDPQRIVQGLMARGLPPHISQGFTGNLGAESNFNPGINEIKPVVPGSRGGWGLAQWTGPRRRQFEAYAADRKKPLDDLDTQLDFLVHELRTTERRAADAIMQAKTPDEAARLVSEKFLRPGIPHMDRRLALTNQIASGQPMPAGQSSPPRQAPAQSQPLGGFTQEQIAAAMEKAPQAIQAMQAPEAPPMQTAPLQPREGYRSNNDALANAMRAMQALQQRRKGLLG